MYMDFSHATVNTRPPSLVYSWKKLIERGCVQALLTQGKSSLFVSLQGVFTCLFAIPFPFVKKPTVAMVIAGHTWCYGSQEAFETQGTFLKDTCGPVVCLPLCCVYLGPV